MTRNEIDSSTVMKSHLENWVQQQYGSQASLDSVIRLGGHSGITFSFNVRAGNETSERLVIKVPPVGVRLSRYTDVLQQVPVLSAMHREGVRVPRVKASAPSSGSFPVPYLIVEYV